MAEPNWWENDPVEAPATMPEPQRPVPGIIRGAPKQASPEEQQRLGMEGERLRLAQEAADRAARKEERELSKGEQQRLTRQAGNERAGQTVLRSTTRALEYLDNMSQGGGLLPAASRKIQAGIIGTDEYQFERQINDLSRNIGLDRLQQMREGSLTGGALGQVPVQQQKMLEETLGSFDITQPAEVLRENLNQLNNIYLDIMFGSRAEREAAMREGRISAEANEDIEQYYRDTEFNLFGRRRDGSSSGGGEQQDNPFAHIIGEDGQPLGPEGGYGQDPETGEWGMHGRVNDDRPNPDDPSIAAEAARQDELRGETNLIDLAGHGMTLGLSDEAAGIGQAISGALTGDFNLSENYAFGRDVEQYRIDQARERYGTLGTVAEVAGGMGLPAGALSRSGRVADAARGGATVGALGGFGYGRGADESLIGTGIGAVGGAALGAGAQRIGNAMVNRGSSQGAQIQQAADDLGVQPIPAVTGGATTRGLTAGARQGFISERPISRAVDRMAEQGQAARSNIAQGTGQVREAEEAGELVRKAAKVYSKRTSEIGGNLYRRADRMAEGVKAPLPKAVQEADNALAELGEAVGGKDSALYKDIAALRNQMSQGEFSIPGVRATRTRLREEMTERGLRGSYSDRLYSKILDAAEDDMITALQAAGKENAVGAMKTASAFWKARVENIDEVLDPLLGKNAPRSGEQILSTLERMARPDSGNASNLARLMRAMPKEEANSIRATVINRLGRPTKGGSQPQDGFSFETFLTNWNNMSMPAKRTMFPAGTIEALEKLATVSQGVKRAGADLNKSNTGRALTSQAVISGGFWLLEPMAAISLGGGQYAVGKLLASPRFARMLAGAPRNADAAGQRAWAQNLGQIAKAEPALAKDIKLFQDAVMRAANDNPAVTASVAEDQNTQ